MIRTLVNQIHLIPYQFLVYLAGGASQALGCLIRYPELPTTSWKLLFRTRGCPRFSCPARFHIATRTSNRSWLSVVTLSKGLRTREDEDEVSSQFLLMAIVNACRIPTPFCADLTEFDMSNESEETFTEDEELEQLLNGDICFKIHIPQMQIERLYVLSGSFNPSHEGHPKLLEVATSVDAASVAMSLHALSYQQEMRTSHRYQWKTVIIYNKPFFYKEAELFPASAFVISADTAVRLLNVIEDFNILDVLKDLFISIPVDTFRMDISSTQIRSRDAQ